MRVTFFCEADFINCDYFIIELSDHSAYSVSNSSKKTFHIIRGKIHYYIERKTFQSYLCFSCGQEIHPKSYEQSIRGI